MAAGPSRKIKSISIHWTKYTIGLYSDTKMNTDHNMIRKTMTVICLFVAMSTVSAALSYAGSKQVVLITADEAKLPASPATGLSFRAGISRGPKVELLSPKPPSAHSPVHLQLKFRGHGGAQIDIDSFKLTYVKNPPVDLTDRVKNFAKPVGVDVPEAVVPPGTHTIRVEIKDKDGRAGSLTFKLKVAKQ
jgi:hypothetical protein